MTLESDPMRTFPVTLAQHQHRPEDNRPVYFFRYLSLRDRRDFLDLITKAREFSAQFASELSGLADTDGPEPMKLSQAAERIAAARAGGQKIVEEAERLVRRLFAGWKSPESPSGERLQGDFDSSRMDEVFDESDLEDLLYTLSGESKVKAVDRKNFIARSLKSSGDVATTAAKQPEA